MSLTDQDMVNLEDDIRHILKGYGVKNIDNIIQNISEVIYDIGDVD